VRALRKNPALIDDIDRQHEFLRCRGGGHGSGAQRAMRRLIERRTP
jgi:hypothetical protein